jgi:hypothetical protein
LNNDASVRGDLVVLSRDSSEPLSIAGQANLATSRYQVVAEAAFCQNLDSYLESGAVIMTLDPRNPKSYSGSLWNALRSFTNRGGRVLYADSDIREVAFPQWHASGPEKVGLFKLNPDGYFRNLKAAAPDGNADLKTFRVEPGEPWHLAELASSAKNRWRNGASLIIPTNWVPQNFVPKSSCGGILCYYADQSLGEFFAAEPGGRLRKVHVENGWSRWTHIVNGNFGGPRGCDFLFYNAAGGGAFYAFNEQDKFVPLSSPMPLSDGWTAIVAGRFRQGDHQHSDLLFYNSANGAAHFNRVGQAGTMETRSQDLGPGWTHIVPGSFVDSDSGFDDLLLYNRESGEHRVCRVRDGSVEWAAIVKRSPDDPAGWQPGWTHVIPGRFSPNSSRTDLFLYSHSLPGIGVLTARGNGGFHASIPAWSEFADWNQILPTQFADNPCATLSFYRG